jgi:pyridoxamine 5'-phosphate oxidase
MADPLREFQNWFDEAAGAGVPEPDAMILATATPDGMPSSRVVLLKGVDARGFRFFTHYESRKARELAANPNAALLFYWFPIHKQVRIEGKIEKLSAAESDEYFASRPRGSQLGAWASPQSQPIPDRANLETRVAELERKYAGKPVPRPPNWGGYRLVPERIEFWTRGENRLHDRLSYARKGGAGASWTVVRLAP